MIDELLKIILEILPMIHPDEAAKIQERIDKWRESYVKNKEALKTALETGDVPALNLLLGDLLDLQS